VDSSKDSSSLIMTGHVAGKYKSVAITQKVCLRVVQWF